MNFVRAKQSRLQLGRCSYEKLREGVLRRDGWRCQYFGSLCDLQVHHMQSRSLLGGDTEENLILYAIGTTDERTCDSLVVAPSTERVSITAN
jgi:hypothetical protein